MSFPKGFYSHGKTTLLVKPSSVQVTFNKTHYSTPGVFVKVKMNKGTSYDIRTNVTFHKVKKTVLLVARKEHGGSVFYKKTILLNGQREVFRFQSPYNQCDIGFLFSGSIPGDSFSINELSFQIVNKKDPVPDNIVCKSPVLIKDPKFEIDQLRTSSAINYFKEKAKYKYKLRNYYDKNTPAIFFGCYKPNDFRHLTYHNSLVLLVWGGTDALRNRQMIRKIRRMKNVYHIAQSSFIERDMIRMGIKRFLYLPFSPTVTEGKYKPIKKGSSVYVYTNPNNPQIYGGSLYTQVMRKMPKTNFILTCQPGALKEFKKNNRFYYFTPRYMSVPHSQIAKLYEKCFVGLRLTDHDGISATVQELGMMGIKTIHNGKTPPCISYRNVDGIVRAINREKKKIGKVNSDIGKKTIDHLKYCDIFLKKVFTPIIINSLPFRLLFDGSSPENFKWRATEDDIIYELTKTTTWKISSIIDKKVQPYGNNKSTDLYPPTDGWTFGNKPSKPIPVETKPVETKPVETKPVVAPKPVVVKPVNQPISPEKSTSACDAPKDSSCSTDSPSAEPKNTVANTSSSCGCVGTCLCTAPPQNSNEDSKQTSDQTHPNQTSKPEKSPSDTQTPCPANSQSKVPPHNEQA
jgi:hypothetical protein